MQNVIKTIESVIINAHLSKAFDLSKKKCLYSMKLVSDVEIVAKIVLCELSFKVIYLRAPFAHLVSHKLILL